MNKSFEENCGIALIVFTILLLFTMVLHPMGGSVEHLIRITKTIVLTHSIAILSIPFGWIGFWGLTRKLGTGDFFSMLGFVTVSVALMAVLLAATTNGIALPLFLQNYQDANPETIATLKPILQYSFAVNHAFDYIYSASFCLAILSWSVSILQTAKLPRWTAWIGFAIVVAAIVIIVAGVAVNSLQGLRLFFAGIVIWIIMLGIVLLKHNHANDPINNHITKS
ncbi:hypothetical protein [Flavitalea sp.]|nr:hypothetical protein [Flavitalea sp.]